MTISSLNRSRPVRSYRSTVYNKTSTNIREGTNKSDKLIQRGNRSLLGAHGKMSFKISAKDFIKINTSNLEEDYDVLEDTILGEGAFGIVYAARHRATGSERAIKVLPKSAYSVEDDEEIRNEFNVLKKMDHPNILKQYHMYETLDNYYICTDIYLGGDLMDFLERGERLTEQECCSLMTTLLGCINYFHHEKIVHRDLKPENILLPSNQRWENLKVIDFGLATELGQGQFLSDSVGTIYYTSPQVLEGQYTSKCDIWSAGVIAFISLAGYCPFQGDSLMEIAHNIVECQADFDDWEDYLSEPAQDFVISLLNYYEEDRPTAMEALMHPLLQARRTNQKALVNRAQRSSMKDALKSMEQFDAQSKLKQACLCLLSSQHISKEEREEIDTVFRIMDADCNGKLTKDELKQAFSDFYNKDLSDEQVDDLFDRINFSGTGAVGYSEFVVACLMMDKNLLNDEKLRAAFDAFDLDGDGTISVDELKEVFSGLTSNVDKVDEELVDAILQQVDENKDGKIDFREFSNMMLLTAAQPSKETLNAWNLIKSKSFKVKRMISAPLPRIPRTSRQTPDDSSSQNCPFEDDNSSTIDNNDSGSSMYLSRRESAARSGACEPPP